MGECEVRLHRDLPLKVGVRVPGGVRMVLDRDRPKHLGLRSELLRVGACEGRVEPGEGRPVLGLERVVGRDGEVAGRAERVEMGEPLGADHERGVREPSGDMHERLVKRRAGGRTGGFERHRGDLGDPQPVC